MAEPGDKDDFYEGIGCGFILIALAVLILSIAKACVMVR